MKNRNLFIATLLVTAAVSVAVVSCKKEKQEASSSNNTEQAVQSADNMDEYLISFKKKLLSAQKGDETISLEQAQLDLGNLLNFDFGDANYPFDVLRYDTLYVKLALGNEGHVDLSQLATTYKDVVAKVLKTYHNANLPEKSVYHVLCSFNKEAKGEQADGQIVLITRGLVNPTLKTSFDETDNWRIDSLRGRCDGTGVGNDHMTMLTQVYYNTHGMIECNEGRAYFTNPRHAYFEARDFQEFSPAGPSYNLSYRLWCGYKSWLPYYCAGYMEMNYYLNNLHDILENWVFLDTDEYVTNIDLSIVDFGSPTSPGGIKSNVKCDFDYVTVNCTSEPPLE